MNTAAYCFVYSLPMLRSKELQICGHLARLGHFMAIILIAPILTKFSYHALSEFCLKKLGNILTECCRPQNNTLAFFH